MKRLFKLISENKFISSVLAVAIVSLCTYLFGGWDHVIPPVWNSIKWVCSAIVSGVSYSVRVPVSILVLLVVITGWLILRAIASVIQATPQPPTTTYLDYREDVFQGVIWRWNYSHGNINFSNMLAFCPHDDTLLVVTSSPPKRYPVPNIPFYAYCETCGQSWPLEFPEHDFSTEGMKRSILRQIDRKIRTGEWRKVVESGLPSAVAREDA